MENIKIKFKEDGPSLEAILIQLAKFKLNSAYIDFEVDNLMKLTDIDK